MVLLSSFAKDEEEPFKAKALAPFHLENRERKVK
jgi:hypothetical protein